ncbi:MAG: sigma factor-like helix-turn-helix DNA-binding protein [Anaerolineales bacterium]
MSEDELIERARQGDGAAWETLVREHQEPAYRLAYLMLGDAQQAEDVTQEAFIRAYRGIEGFDATRPRLDQKDQQVIYLRYFLNLPIAEAAGALGVPEGTVKSRTHRALNRLQAVIDRDFPSLRDGWTE